MANDVSTSFFTEYTLNKTQSQAVEAAVAACQAAQTATQALYDALIASGIDNDGISPEDIAAILAAKDAAVAAQVVVLDALATVQAAEAAVLSNTSLSQGYRDAARDASEAATAVQEAVDAAVALINSQVETVEDIAEQASLSGESAEASANTATAAADLTERMANEVPGVEVLPGKYSGNHYLEACRAASVVAASFKKRVLGNQPSDTYTLTVNDLFRTLEFNVTNATTVKLPVNLWQLVDPEDGSPTEAWVHCRRHKDSTAIVTFVADAIATVLNPAVLNHAIFPYASEPAASNPVGSHSFSVPAGTARRIAFLVEVIYENGKVGRNTQLSATGVTGLTKAGGDSSEQDYTKAGAVDACLWEAQVSGTSNATVNITLTTDGNVLSYVLYVIAVSNTASFQSSPVCSSVTTADTQHELTLTSVDNKSVSVFLIGHQGNDALPLTAGLSGGTLLYSGKTPKARATKDIAYVAGFEFVETAGANTYTSTSTKSARGAVVGVIFRPDTSGTVSAVLTAPDGATLSAAGKACTIFAHSDGINYTKED